MTELIQSAQAYEPRLVAMTLAVDWPVNWARLATPLQACQSGVGRSHLRCTYQIAPGYMRLASLLRPDVPIERTHR